jgi:alkylation response protein AidB-like acyl-CoA dehydrogenase
VDFDDTPDEAAFRAEARAWLDAHAPAKGGPDDFSGGYLEGTSDVHTHVARAKEWQKLLFDEGWAGITWPTRYGGRGGTAVQSTIWNQEMGRYGVTVGPFAMGIGMAGPTILRHGTDEQKDRFLVPMLKGEEMWCQLFSEPEAGSDLAALRTRAVQDGDDWVVTGQKVWTSSAEVADWGILLARTDLDATKRKGITYFLVDMRTPGIEVRPLRQMTGSSHFSEVFLDEVRIPGDMVLGDVHGGWAVTQTTLMNERGLIAGGNKASDAVALCALAQKLGRTDDPMVRQGLMDVWILQKIQTFHGYRLQTALSQGRQPGPETSIMKLFAAEYLRRLGDVALEVLGADGMRAGEGPGGGDWQARFLHAPAIRIAGGSNEVQRNIIGERALGLPREPQVDDVPFRDLLAGRR